jgi:ferrous iron transport protein B
VAAVTLTLFIPCIAQFLIMKKRGMKVALSIGLFVSFLAFSSGWLLNQFLFNTGIL